MVKSWAYSICPSIHTPALRLAFIIYLAIRCIIIFACFLLYNLFHLQMKYRWGKPNDENNHCWRERCCEVFHRIARCRYSNILTNTRRDVTKKAGSNDPASWKPFNPRWLSTEHWEELCDYWASPAWQKRSAQMRTNRMKSGVHVYHRQGRSNSYTLCRTMVTIQLSTLILGLSKCTELFNNNIFCET
jgi:hypothetical protein